MSGVKSSAFQSRNNEHLAKAVEYAVCCKKSGEEKETYAKKLKGEQVYNACDEGYMKSISRMKKDLLANID
ncbi:MAG: hypothetical protein IPI78_18855 [Chitinophagaceae bacterium]|nr:hypothetical protein [Chitinophagaceae bacterium]